MRKQSNNWERLARHISVCDYKNVNTVLSVAMKNGSSPSAMVAKLSDAIQGTYTPHPTVTQFDVDLAYLTQSIGGPRLLFAMNSSLNLPSYRSLMRRQKVPVMIPSISVPTQTEVNENIGHFFCEQQRPRDMPACGHSLLLDGVALEEKCRYLRSVDSILGVCREHGGGLDLRVLSAESVLAVDAALHNEKPCAHYASEATVVAVAPFQNTSYFAVPIALSGSCKGETGDGMAVWLQEVIRAWRENEDGEMAHGPLWSVATDGESTMRSCRFQLCMSQELSPSNPLHHLLRNLPGLNLFTGPGDLTMTCDPKHLFKSMCRESLRGAVTDKCIGFATLLRSREGILVHRTVVNKNQLRSHLARLPDIDAKTIKSLIDPADKQNVPKAVALIQYIGQLRNLNTSSYTPSRLEEHCVLGVLGEVFNSFMRPFIDVQMTLTEQVTSLIKYSHLAFSLYQKHGTQFMTSALYSDTQATVKDVIFCIAKQKLLDPSKPFYIIQVGSDRLEMCFCNARTQTHHRNFDILELSYKLATASIISSIYIRHPELDSGSRRLNLTNTIGVDHVNPKSWIGDVIVDNVSLQVCWEKGRNEAQAFLSSLFPQDQLDNLSRILSQHDRDLLRPFGSYIGFSGDPDLSDDTSGTAQGRGDPKGDSARGAEGVLSDSDEQSVTDLEERLPDVVGEPILDHEPRDWLVIEGTKYRKSSVVAQNLKADRSKKLVERTLRVQGLTLDDLRKHSATDVPSGTESNGFFVGDIAATLAHTDSSICLMVIQAIEIRKEKATFPSISMDTLQDPKSGIHIRAQVVQLVQADTVVWAWPPHEFLRVSKPKATKSASARPQLTVHDLTITCPAWLCSPITPDIRKTRELFPDVAPGSSSECTWALSSESLSTLSELSWSEARREGICDLDSIVETLPLVEDPNSLPYQDKSGGFRSNQVELSPSLTPLAGAACFTILEFNANARAVGADEKPTVTCILCDRPIKLAHMRAHVGRHILHHMYRMNDDSLVRNVSEMRQATLSLIPIWC